jgi:surface glycoprotein (TIGR04207 family)
MSDTIHDTNNMTERTQKLRAVVLAALMVLSVIAMGTAFVGTAAATAEVQISASGQTLIGETSDIVVTDGEVTDITVSVKDDFDTSGADVGDSFNLSFDFDNGASVSSTSSVSAEITEATEEIELSASSIDSTGKGIVELEFSFVNTLIGTDNQLDYEFTVTDIQFGDGTSEGELKQTVAQGDLNSNPEGFIDGGLAKSDQIDFDFSFVSRDGNTDDRSTASAIDLTDSDDHRVYLGEESLSFDDSSTITGAELFKKTGNAEGTPLGEDISLDTPTGAYDNDAATGDVIVVEPRITTFDVNQGGTDVSESTMLQGLGNTVPEEVNVTYNLRHQ